MVNSLYNKLIGQGLNPGEVGTLLKGIERIGKNLNRSVEKQFSIFINNLQNDIKMEEYAKNPIAIEDIKNVAKELNFAEPNEMQLDEIILRYPVAQEEDQTGTWDLVVESLLYDVMDEKYDFELAISNEEITDIANSLKKEINPEIIREVKNLYYQNNDIDKERNKVNLLKKYIDAVCQYL